MKEHINTSKDVIELKNVIVKYGSKVRALDNVSLLLKSPFYAVVMGPNGAGKTTLLKVIAGLLKPTKGLVNVYGYIPFKNKKIISKKVSYVPQLIQVDESVPITVKDVILMGLLSDKGPIRISSKEYEDAVDNVLEILNINQYKSKLFSELSGGLKQRVMIARALVRKPKLLLLDEPFSMMDPEMKCELAGLLFKLFKYLKVDILMVAHEISPCIPFEPTVILLNRKIYAVGKAHEVLKSEFLKNMYPGFTEFKNILVLGEDHG